LIDKAITSRIIEILEQRKFCTKPEAKEISEEVADIIREEFQHDLASCSSELERLLKMNDRLWDTVHGMQEAKHSYLREFLKFKWFMFWRKWI